MSRKTYDVDLCIIGAGAGGLSVAAGAAQLGRSVVLYEAGEMGGDCLNHGCVPSKAMIAAGKHAAAIRDGAASMGIAGQTPKIDFAAVKHHVQDVIAQIAPVDSQERFEGFGCTVIREFARFKDANTAISDNTEVRAKRFIISTGSIASAPPIPGLADVPYLTNEDIFSLDALPKKLLVIGAGPIGLELGQSFFRLGSDVEIFDAFEPLGRSEPEHAKVLIDALKEEGLGFRAPASIEKVSSTKTTVKIHLTDGTVISGSHLLVAAGRRPVTEGLDLDKAGVEVDKRGYVVTDDCLRSTNKRVFAAGDASGKGGLTHAAGFHAGQIIKAFYFSPPLINRIAGKAVTDRMPAAIYTEPELANIGLTEAAAIKAHGEANVRCVSFDLEENDRAIAERDLHGGIKIVATTKGKVLGASAVGEGAGEIIQLISLAMTNKIKISGLATFISPYPTRSEIVKRAAGSWYTDAVFGPKGKFMAKLMSRFH